MCAKFERKIKQSKHVKIKNIGFIYFISPVFQVALVIYMNSQIALIHHIDALLPKPNVVYVDIEMDVYLMPKQSVKVN